MQWKTSPKPKNPGSHPQRVGSSSIFFPPQYKEPKTDSPYVRLLRVTDYICGMTDRYAVDLYRHISRISLP